MNFRMNADDTLSTWNDKFFVWYYPAAPVDSGDRGFVVMGEVRKDQRGDDWIKLKGTDEAKSYIEVGNPDGFYNVDDKLGFLDYLGIPFSCECTMHECDCCGMYYDYEVVIDNEVYSEDGHFGYTWCPSVVEMIYKHGHLSETLTKNMLTETHDGFTINGKTYDSISDALESILRDLSAE